jgi:hypothetical protein
MKQGKTAKQALDELLKADAHNEGRQVAMVDAKGNVAGYTGKSCIPDAGDEQGVQFSCQANLMSSAKIWPAMKAAYEAAQGDLSERLMQALEAAEKAGGDIRGRQSAAMVVVKGERGANPWDNVVVLRRGQRPSAGRAASAPPAAARVQPRGRGRQLHDRGSARAARPTPGDGLAPTWSNSSSGPRPRVPERPESRRWRCSSKCSKRGPWVPLVERCRMGLFPADPKAVAEVQALATKGAPW